MTKKSPEPEDKPAEPKKSGLPGIEDLIKAQQEAILGLNKKLEKLQAELAARPVPMITTADRADEVRFAKAVPERVHDMTELPNYIVEKFPNTHFRFCDRKQIDKRKSWGYALIEYDENFLHKEFTRTADNCVQLWDTLLMGIEKEKHARIVASRQMQADIRERGFKDDFHNKSYRAGFTPIEVDKDGRPLSG